MGGIVSSAAGWRPAGVILVSTRFATGDSDRELLAAPGSLSWTGFPRPSSGGSTMQRQLFSSSTVDSWYGTCRAYSTLWAPESELGRLASELRQAFPGLTAVTLIQQVVLIWRRAIASPASSGQHQIFAHTRHLDI